MRERLARARLRVGAAEALGAERVAALRYAVVVLAATRVAMLVVALLAEATTEPRRNPRAGEFDDPSLAAGLPQPLAAVLGVWARWDSVWYLRIARDGYADDGSAAFFPLYPLAMRVLGPVTGGHLAAGVLVSLGASLAALYLLHRLTTAEAGAIAARRAVLYLAVAPVAVFMAAVYAEALLVALSLAAVWAARRGRFPAAGAWAGLAAATRPAGLLLLVPLVIMWVDHRGGWRRAAAPGAWFLVLVPAGLAAYAAHLAVRLGNPVAFASAQEAWDRRLATPVHGAWDALAAAWAGARQLASGGADPVYWARSTRDPIRIAALNLELLVVLAALALGVWLCFRTLPRAYAWYALAAVLLPLCTPGRVFPLLSLPRFGLAVFPVFMALAVWAGRRPAVHTAVLVGFPLVLGMVLAQWATWQWVA